MVLFNLSYLNLSNLISYTIRYHSLNHLQATFICISCFLPYGNLMVLTSFLSKQKIDIKSDIRSLSFCLGFVNKCVCDKNLSGLIKGFSSTFLGLVDFNKNKFCPASKNIQSVKSKCNNFN